MNKKIHSCANNRKNAIRLQNFLLSIRKVPVVWALFLIFTISLSALEIDAKAEMVEIENGYSLKAINNEPTEIFLHIDFDLKSFVASLELPAVLPLQPGINEDILRLTAVEEASEFSYSMQYSFIFADPSSIEPDKYLYYFPFEHGSAHRIGQGWKGSFSHYGQNLYAVDFDMDTGTKIYAARDGIVVSLKEDSRIGGNSSAYAKHTNFILVKHSDNTFANYVHLQYNGALVSKGTAVAAGDLIALSGSTGITTGPHLHFDIRVPNARGAMTSIPFMFRGKNGEAIEPQEGHTYYSYHLGGEEFTERRGQDIALTDFEGYSKTVAAELATDKIEIREEVYDDRLVLFIGNGNNFAIAAEVDLIMRNLNSLQGNPIKISLKAREEKFLTIVTIQDLTKGYRMQSKIQYRINQE